MTFEPDTFNYTDSFTNPKTDSPVDEAYYSAETEELVVVLGEDRSAYLYENVPPTTFENFKAADSKGRFYATRIKPYFGPGKWLGYEPEFVVSRPAPAPVTTSNVSLLDVSTLTTLAPALPEDKATKYAVRFTVEGGNSVKVNTVEATGFDAAVAALGLALEALDLDYEVKGVDVV